MIIIIVFLTYYYSSLRWQTFAIAMNLCCLKMTTGGDVQLKREYSVLVTVSRANIPIYSL